MFTASVPAVTLAQARAGMEIVVAGVLKEEGAQDLCPELVDFGAGFLVVDTDQLQDLDVYLGRKAIHFCQALSIDWTSKLEVSCSRKLDYALTSQDPHINLP